MKPQTAQLSTPVAMRLAHFQDNWKVLTTDKWVLEAVKGFQIPFISQPVQECQPNPPISSKEQSSLIQEEVKALLEKGAIVPVQDCHLQKRVSLEPLPCPQERRSNEASHQP